MQPEFGIRWPPTTHETHSRNYEKTSTSSPILSTNDTGCREVGWSHQEPETDGLNASPFVRNLRGLMVCAPRLEDTRLGNNGLHLGLGIVM